MYCSRCFFSLSFPFPAAAGVGQAAWGSKSKGKLIILHLGLIFIWVSSLISSLHSIQIFMLAGADGRGKSSCRWWRGQSILSSSKADLHWGFVLLCHSMLDRTASGGGFVTRMLHRALGQPRHRGCTHPQKAGTVLAHLTKDFHDHLPSQFSLISSFLSHRKYRQILTLKAF